MISTLSVPDFKGWSVLVSITKHLTYITSNKSNCNHQPQKIKQSNQQPQHKQTILKLIQQRSVILFASRESCPKYYIPKWGADSEPSFFPSEVMLVVVFLELPEPASTVLGGVNVV